MLHIALLTLWVVGTVADKNSTLSDHFSHHVVLDRDGAVHLSWTPEKEGITFLVEVATHGYVGLGFSPGGGMHGADIVLCWVDSRGKVHLTDRHAVGNNVPYLDNSQDLRLPLRGVSQQETFRSPRSKLGEAPEAWLVFSNEGGMVQDGGLSTDRALPVNLANSIGSRLQVHSTCATVQKVTI